MNINLNVSTRFQSNNQDAVSGSEIDLNKSDFIKMLEEIDLNINEDENEETIDLNLIQNILNNLQLMNQIKDNTNDFSNLEIDLSEIKISSNFEQISELSQLIKDENIKLNEEKIIDLDKIFKNDSINIEDIKNVLMSESDKSDFKFLNTKEINNQPKDTIKTNVDQESLDLEEINEYNQLEISSMSTKITKIKSDDMKIVDKDLNTLENILDLNENKFMGLNNVSNIDTSKTVDESIDNAQPTEIRQEFIGEDIVKTVKYLKSNGIEEINIKISPRELGDMTIKLIRNPEETKVVISLSRDDVFDLVSKNIGDITKHLNELNIKVSEVSVDIKSDNQKFFSDNLSQQFNNKSQQEQKKKNKYENISSENIDSIKDIKVEEENLNILI